MTPPRNITSNTRFHTNNDSLPDWAAKIGDAFVLRTLHYESINAERGRWSVQMSCSAQQGSNWTCIYWNPQLVCFFTPLVIFNCISLFDLKTWLVAGKSCTKQNNCNFATHYRAFSCHDCHMFTCVWKPGKAALTLHYVSWYLVCLKLRRNAVAVSLLSDDDVQKLWITGLSVHKVDVAEQNIGNGCLKKHDWEGLSRNKKKEMERDN